MSTSALRHRVARAVPHGLSEVAAHEAQQAFESPRSEAAPEPIARIVRHATETVPFYRRLGQAHFAELPVVDKTMMVADLSSFLTDGARTNRLPSRMSSGSSGIPFTTYLDTSRLALHRAALVGGYRYLGADPFGPLVHCRSWIRASRRDRLSYALRGQYLYSGEQDERSVRAVARWISDHRGTTLMGLPSFLENLLRAVEKFSIPIPPGAIGVALGAGEPPSQYLTEAVPRLLGVELSRRYSNTEHGMLGLARGASEHYRLDTRTFHVEILDLEHDAPAPPGAIGRIVVTDLYNRAMPFLRYDTGDLGRFALGADGRPIPNVLADLTGRLSDVPIGGTESAPTRALHYALFMQVDTSPEIRQFQLRQHAIGRFTWILNAEPSTALEARIRRLMDEEIGDILSCEFRYVPDVPLSQSGKKRFFINEIPGAAALPESTPS